MVFRLSLTTARPDTVWVKVNPTKKYAAEHVLEKFVNNGDSSEAAEAGEAGEAGQ